jgi:hypothetical protein
MILIGQFLVSNLLESQSAVRTHRHWNHTHSITHGRPQRALRLASHNFSCFINFPALRRLAGFGAAAFSDIYIKRNEEPEKK